MSTLSAEEFRSLLLSVGSHRAGRPLSPVEVARLLARLRASGSDYRKIGELLHLRDTSVLSEFVGLLELPEDVQTLVDWGRGSGATLPFSVAREFSRLSHSDQSELARIALGHGLSSPEVKQVVQLRLRSGRAVSECAEEIQRLRPKVVQKHVLIGVINDEALKVVLERKTQAERDELLLRALVRLYGEEATQDAQARLGPGRFVVVGGLPLQRLAVAGADFEHDVVGQVWRLLGEAEQ